MMIMVKIAKMLVDSDGDFNKFSYIILMNSYKYRSTPTIFSD
jgi:hypothetical protein